MSATTKRRMKPHPQIKPTVKTPKNPKTSAAVNSIIREIISKFPSMTADEARTCALNIFSQCKEKQRRTDADGLTRKAVTSLAKEIIIHYGGLTLVGRRTDAFAQALLRIWAVPNNELEIVRFLETLTRGRVLHEKIDKLLGKPAKLGTTAKP